MSIAKIEVYLNHADEPVRVLTQPPFKVNYDTRSLPDGEHTLKVVTYYLNGAKEIKEIPFKVSNTPGVLVQGLDEGKEVSGDLDLTLRVADPNVRPGREKFPGIAFAVSTAVVLLGVWGFFAINPGATQKTLEEVAAPHKEGKGGDHSTATTKTEVDAALLKEGEAVYAQNCVGCHQADGTGNASANFPALAGEKELSDTKMVVSIVHKGKGSMPAIGAGFTDKQLAAVATYVRNSWGNKFGGVSVAQAAGYK
jgi:cytochrome c oxidase subunit II